MRSNRKPEKVMAAQRRYDFRALSVMGRAGNRERRRIREQRELENEAHEMIIAERSSREETSDDEYLPYSA